MNYYRRYSGDYLRDTARLSMLEHGAYSLLLDYYYSEEQPLPSDLNEIYVMVRAMTPADRKAVEKVLAKYFFLEDDGYHNKRADHEIAVSLKARNNGGKGGRPARTETGTQTGIETGQETETQTTDTTGEGGGSVHPPTTNHQPPSPSLHPPEKTPPLRVVGDPIFGEYIEFLQGKGVTPPSARTFLALMRRSYGDDLTVECFNEARRLDVTSPKPWISKSLQVRSLNREKGQQGNSQTVKGVNALQDAKRSLRE